MPLIKTKGGKMKNRNAVSRMKRVVKGRHWEYREYLNKYRHWEYMMDESGWIPY